MGITGLITISVLTLNVWGLPDAGFKVLSPFRSERIAAICVELKKAYEKKDGWDVIFLQETWVKRDRETLSKCGYPFVVESNDPKRVLDHGLMVLSKHPISKATRLTFPALPGGIEATEEGESLARKSAIAAKVSHPSAGDVWVANTHLVSYYADESRDKFYEIRRRQFVMFARWAKSLSGNLPLVLGGDLNFGAHNKKLWDEKKRELPEFGSSVESERTTTLSRKNTFQTEDQGRVDHIFSSEHFSRQQGELAFDGLIRENDGTEISFSDHYGWTERMALPKKADMAFPSSSP